MMLQCSGHTRWHHQLFPVFENKLCIVALSCNLFLRESCTHTNSVALICDLSVATGTTLNLGVTEWNKGAGTVGWGASRHTFHSREAIVLDNYLDLNLQLSLFRTLRQALPYHLATSLKWQRLHDAVPASILTASGTCDLTLFTVQPRTGWHAACVCSHSP